MHPCRLIVPALLVASLSAAAAQACPNHTRTAAVVAPTSAVTAAHSAVAWKPRAWSPSALPTTAAQGLRVAIDPVDGTLSLPVADPLESRLMIEDDRQPAATMRRSNGSVRATLDDRFAEFAVARLAGDGKPVWTCVEGPKGVQQFLKTTPGPIRPLTGPAPGVVWEVQ